MTAIIVAEMVGNEGLPERDFLIESMAVYPGDMIAFIVDDRRMRWDLIEYLDGSKNPKKGKVEFFNKNGDKGPIRISTVTKNRCYLGDMTVSEYMDHFRILSGLPANKIKKEEILASLKLSRVADCKIYTIPFDGRRFAEIARALYTEPDLLIIDMTDFPNWIDTDPAFAEIVKKWSCEWHNACIMISDKTIIDNPVFERVFLHQFGRIVEDMKRKTSLKTLGWLKFDIGVDKVGDAIKVLEAREGVEVAGSKGSNIRISLDEKLNISEINKELVDNGIGVESINPMDDLKGVVI